VVLVVVVVLHNQQEPMATLEVIHQSRATKVVTTIKTLTTVVVVVAQARQPQTLYQTLTALQVVQEVTLTTA
jgi:hypothetical protein